MCGRIPHVLHVAQKKTHYSLHIPSLLDTVYIQFDSPEVWQLYLCLLVLHSCKNQSVLFSTGLQIGKHCLAR